MAIISSKYVEYLQKKIDALSIVNQLWQKTVHAPLRNQTWVANFREGTLIVEVTNAAWASRLQYESFVLIVQLKKYSVFQHLETIKVYIQSKPRYYPMMQAKKFVISLSVENQQLLYALANTIKNTSLKTAILRLAKKS